MRYVVSYLELADRTTPHEPKKYSRSMTQFVTGESPLVSKLVSNVQTNNKLFQRIRSAYPPSKSNFSVNNPNTGAHVIDLPTDTTESTNEKISKISSAFKPWSKLTNKQRADIIRNFGVKIQEHQKDLAELLSVENGKPLAESMVEVGYGPNAANWFAAEAQREYGQVIPSAQPGRKWITTKEPVGPCAMITPWNFPSSMITRKAIPALAAGCTVVLKPAELTPLSALGLKIVANDAGIPDDAFQIVLSSHENVKDVGLAMTTNEAIKAVSFTGSTGVGKILLQQAASNVRKSCMELGGLAPFIVAKSANLKNAVEGVLNGKFRGQGQVCIAPQRILVNEEVYDQFVAILKARMEEKLVFGPQEDRKTTMGPLISKAGIDNVAAQVDDAVAKGATVVLGGNRCDDLGPLWHEPTRKYFCAKKIDIS